MKSYHWVLVTSLLVLVELACTQTAPEPVLLRPATIKDIMVSMVDPSGDFLFESVQEIADERGITRKAPTTEAEWTEVRRHLLILVEAQNLLAMEGRRAARPEDRSSYPDVEMQPEEIQKLLEANHPDFVRRARSLQDAAVGAMKAVDTKDVEALSRGLTAIDRACESCHLRYWYREAATSQP